MRRFACLAVLALGAAGLAGCADTYGDDGYYGSSRYYGDGRYYERDGYGYRDSSISRRQLERDRDRAAARDPNCRATWLHQDRPGGSSYEPWRGAPSC